MPKPKKPSQYVTYTNFTYHDVESLRLADIRSMTVSLDTGLIVSFIPEEEPEEEKGVVASSSSSSNPLDIPIPTPSSTSTIIDLSGSFVAPAYVDLQTNGLAGIDYATTNMTTDDVVREEKAQGREGVGEWLRTVVCVEDYRGRIEKLGKRKLHLEGPCEF